MTFTFLGEVTDGSCIADCVWLLYTGVRPAQCSAAGTSRSLLHQDENTDDPQVRIPHDPRWTQVQQGLAGD